MLLDSGGWKEGSRESHARKELPETGMKSRPHAGWRPWRVLEGGGALLPNVPGAPTMCHALSWPQRGQTDNRAGQLGAVGTGGTPHPWATAPSGTAWLCFRGQQHWGAGTCHDKCKPRMWISPLRTNRQCMNRQQRALQRCVLHGRGKPWASPHKLALRPAPRSHNHSLLQIPFP